MPKKTRIVGLKIKRGKQSINIRQWEPWEQSTVPKTAKGKAKSSQNARISRAYKEWKWICQVLGIDPKTTHSINQPVHYLQSALIFDGRVLHSGQFKARLSVDKTRILSKSIEYEYHCNSRGDRFPNPDDVRAWLNQ